MRYSLQRTTIYRRPMKLGAIVILIASVVLFSMLLIIHLIYFSQISNTTRDASASKALAVALALANSPEIRQGLMKRPEESGIQTVAQAVNKSSDFLFIAVIDMQNICYSQPEVQRIGQPFKDDDILLAPQGKENAAINRGFLAKTLRVPTLIYDEYHRQIGAVSIGLGLSRVAEQISNGCGSITWPILSGVLVELLSTWVLVKVLRRILFGPEPYEISSLFEQRQAMLHFIKEGVIVVDEYGEVTLVNQVAQEPLDYHKSQDDAQLFTLSRAWSQVVDSSQVLRDGTPHRDEEIMVKDRLLLINAVLVLSNDKITGAILIFRDKTEVRELTQRLDGMVNCADVLRERPHELVNKLHVILGLLHLKGYKQPENHILKTVNNYQEEIGSLLGKIESPVIAGSSLSRINCTSDLSHSLVISNENQLSENNNEGQVAVLITVLGNLIGNALEALGQEPGGETSVSLHYRHSWLHYEVSDDGPGTAPENIEHIFEKGVSSRGIEWDVDLALVKQQVENVGGNISVESEPGIFTQLFVQLPWSGERTSR